MPEYTPGVCNINPAEIAKRRLAGHIGLIAFVVVLLILLATDANRWLRVILVLPAMLAAIGYLQARAKFCVGFAAAGIQRAADDAAETSAVSANDSVKDLNRAQSIKLQAGAIAVLVTLVSLLLPSRL